MLAYDMSERGSLSLYEYLYRRIRDDVTSGALAADERLPSKRALAQHLGVSVITVEGAYAQLVAEGYVVSRPRRGFYVAELPQAPASPWPAAQPRASRPEQAGHEVLADFSRPTTSARSSSAALWSRALRDALAHEPEDELFGIPPARGSARLRMAIAAHLEASLGVTVDPERVVVGAGAQVLYALVAQLLQLTGGATAPAEHARRLFAVEDPGYPRVSQVYEACGARVRYLPLDEEGIDMAALRASAAEVVHVMPSHQFPTGRVTSIARRYELLGWASEAPGRYIVEDDYDREFRLAGKPIPPLCSIDAEGRVIYVSTFSKSLSSALRMAYMVLPGQLAGRFGTELGFYANTVSMVDQVTLARLFESGAYERHVSRYRKRQRDVRDALVAALRESRLGPRMHIEEADSGLHFVLAVETGRGEREVARRAAEWGVVLAPLSGYLHDASNAIPPDGRASFVMQYAGLDLGVLPRVVYVLEQASL